LVRQGGGKKEGLRRTDFVIFLQFFGLVYKDFKDNIWILCIRCNNKFYEFRNRLVVEVLFIVPRSAAEDHQGKNAYADVNDKDDGRKVRKWNAQ